ncbi:MAG: hypothetical protein IKG21_05440 [Atopobiaceae bacterium]|nr:hypothetical protein [Atopobiaceae bacterium]
MSTMHLNKLLAIYRALGLSLVVERIDPTDAANQDELSQEQIIANFLAQVGGISRG